MNKKSDKLEKQNLNPKEDTEKEFTLYRPWHLTLYNITNNISYIIFNILIILIVFFTLGYIIVPIIFFKSGLYFIFNILFFNKISQLILNVS